MFGEGWEVLEFASLWDRGMEFPRLGSPGQGDPDPHGSCSVSVRAEDQADFLQGLTPALQEADSFLFSYSASPNLCVSSPAPSSESTHSLAQNN